MAGPKIKRKGLDWKELLKEEKDFLKAAIEEVVQEVLEAEMDEAIGARKSERTPERPSYRSGYYSRGLVTGWASWNWKYRKIGKGVSARKSLSAINAAKKRWCLHWPSCTCRAFRHEK